MTFEEIKELIKLVSKTGIGKVQVEKEDFKVTISGSRPASEQPIIVQSPQPAISVPSSVPASAEAQPERTIYECRKYIQCRRYALCY